MSAHCAHKNYMRYTDNRRLFTLLIISALLALLGLLLQPWLHPGPGRAENPLPADPTRTTPTSSPAATAPTSASLPTAAPALTAPPPPPPRSPLADALGAPTTPPAREAALVLDLCQAYRRQLQGFPAGEDNRGFTRQLTGQNRARLAFLPPDHPRISPRGELVDTWGTPFFFHLLDRDQLDVRSAGPDREMYTADDVLARTPRPGASPTGTTGTAPY